tara:strand:+ start:369 stop:1313 length:945 start_codon:yes stop_codon:yes gene_type:complete
MKNQSLSILFLGAGKRVSLLKSFIKASKELKINLKMYSYELDNYQPISKHAKIIVGEKWSSRNLENDLLKVIEKYKIQLLVSNSDPATLCHSKLRTVHEAAKNVSPIDKVNTCLSKNIFQKYCELNFLPIIPKAEEDEFPCFAKPAIGSASKGIRLILTKDEKKKFLKNQTEDFIFQKYIDGTEYTVDAYISNAKKICVISPRVRLSTSGGESVISQTINNEYIVKMSKDIINKLDLIGPVTIQFIQDKFNKKFYLMEVNPRLGGAVLASIEAGYNIPKIMLQDATNLKTDIILKGKEILMKRYFMEEYYETNN